ncbi:MAG: SDR family NAD(P)-dependent oxidoreductase [Dehalococcoidia bacterium]
MRLQGKVALITGAASGIGKATALLFANEGAKVVLTDLQQEKGEEAAEAIKRAGGDALFVRMDVTREDEVKGGLEVVVTTYGRLDILFANAGIISPTPIPTEKLSEEQWDKILNVNLKGHFFCSKHAISHMRRNGGGSIVMTASANAFSAYPPDSSYNVSKAGVVMLAKVLALELAADNIRVNCVAPGYTDTAMMVYILDVADDPKQVKRETEALHPMNRWAKPEEIAQGVLYLASDEASFVTGTVLSIDGGYLAQ